MFLTDDEIDLRLRDADPASTPLNAGLDPSARALRDHIVTGRMRRRMWQGPRSFVKAGLSAVVAIGLLGGGTMALAGDGNETPWGWVADNVFYVRDSADTVCFNGIEVRYEGVDEDSPIVVDAREIVRDIDIESLDTHDAEAVIRDEMSNAIGLDGDPEPLVMSDAQVQQQAIVRVVSRLLWKGLEAKGHDIDPSPVSLSGRSEGCGG